MFSIVDFEAICFDTDNAQQPTATENISHYQRGLNYAKTTRLHNTVLGLYEGHVNAITSSGHHPDFIAGCLAGARGKNVRFVQTTFSGNPARIGVNHYTLEGSNEPILISYPLSPSARKSEQVQYLKSIAQIPDEKITFLPKPSLIISSQTPQRKMVFPQEGGTALALHTITGLPVIKMHRDSKARDFEKPVLERIANDSTVYITGHSSLQSETLGGLYRNLHAVEKKSWTLQNYRDLILSQSQLQENDTLTIVLWACEAGGGGINSVAAKLALLFQEKGINTRIIASTVEMLRFDGKPEKNETLVKMGAIAFNPNDQYNPEGRLRFRTAKPGTVRIFSCNRNGLFESKNKGDIFFTPEGITGIDLTKTITHQCRATLEITQSPYFRKELTKREDAETVLHQMFKKNPSTSPCLLRPSSHQMTGYFTFAVSYLNKENKQCEHMLYRIDNKGQLFNTELPNEVGKLIPLNGLTPLAQIMQINSALFPGITHTGKQEVNEGTAITENEEALPLPLQSPSPVSLPKTTYDDTTPLHKKIQLAVQQASSHYQTYHTIGLHDRGFKSGWFSFFRHGQKGRDNAFQLSTADVWQKGSVKEMVNFLRETTHLRFHHHSFGSYLFDELKTVVEKLDPNRSVDNWDDLLDELPVLAMNP